MLLGLYTDVKIIIWNLGSILEYKMTHKDSKTGELLILA